MIVWLLTCALMASVPAGASAQVPPGEVTREDLDYPWTLTGSEGGFGDYTVGDQQSRILSVPISIWIRRLEKGRKLGLRLRLTGVIGFTDFERPRDFDARSLRFGGIFPGIEFLIPLSPTSMLRPFADLGLGLTDGNIEELLLSTFGMRTEFVFPWRRWELGLEPRLQGGFSRATGTEADDGYVQITSRVDARYPLGFRIGGHTPDIGAYFEPGFFLDALGFTTVSGQELRIDEQHEVGVTLGFREQAPKIWFIRVPRLSVGYRFGDGLTGLRIRIGGDRVTRLPLRGSPVGAAGQ